MPASIAILDFGSQYAQIIARRVRENNVYCELFPFDAPAEQVLAIAPKGFILSGGPASVYAENAPQIASYILDSGLPILGICYGMQALTHALGGQVDPANEREFGVARVKITSSNRLLGSAKAPAVPSGGIGNEFPALMSHGDRITKMPAGFISLAKSGNSPHAAMGDLERNYYGVQFHPEVHHTPGGSEILRRFAVEICKATPDWTAESIIESKVEEIRTQVGGARVLSAVSGGVDSSVATALVHRAIGDQLVSIYVDTGLMRENESAGVISAFREHLGAELIAVDAEDEFLGALVGVTDPEKKRRIVGEKFIRIFEEQAKSLGKPKFLVQGTIYPDVVESSAPDRNKAEK
ncbi:MAG TPA: glutamine-hydrolyzing GMP synthase, partial [Anaerolineales bacterium]|nr:glutamine-hydrolyzing GMP synthase [Anaerolineales bacterium]